jgi:hypothetical protein
LVLEKLYKEMDQESFHISFTRYGGFAGRTNQAEIDSSELDDAEAGELRHMIVRSGFFEVLALNPQVLQMPDQFSYEITIEHGGKKRTLELNDTNVPELLRPLINHLVRASRSAKRR